MRKLAAGALCAAALVALSAAPAAARDPAESGTGTGFLYLEIDRESGQTERAALACPGGQGHPRGADACVNLTGADGDIAAIAPADGLCTKEFAPVTLKGFGIWDGRFVSYEREFDNACEGVLATGGALFDLAEE